MEKSNKKNDFIFNFLYDLCITFFINIRQFLDTNSEIRAKINDEIMKINCN